jgi:CheY-like chemotaxis protein
MAGGASERKKVVFVVEDDPAVRALVVKALQSKGYEVMEAENGLKASELLGGTKLPDLLICDVMMPMIDGFSFARMVQGHKELKGMPIIFLTAKSQPKDVAMATTLGARHFITKPFSISDLLEKVEKTIR